MNWFSKKKLTNTAKSESMSGEHILNPNMEKFERIFIENKESATENADMNTTQIEKSSEQQELKSAIDRFFESDHYNMGFSDGYNHQSTEMMKSKVEEISADFSLLIFNEIERWEEQINVLLIQQAKLSGDDLTDTRNALQVRIDQYQGRVKSLRLQADLCDTQQGWIRRAVLSYKNGFIKGVNEFHEMELFTNQTGILNQ